MAKSDKELPTKRCLPRQRQCDDTVTKFKQQDVWKKLKLSKFVFHLQYMLITYVLTQDNIYWLGHTSENA